MKPRKFKVSNPLLDNQDYLVYPLFGTPVFRASSAPSPERVKSDPAFHKFRMNSNELGGAATLAKAIRSPHIQPIIDQFKDTYMVSRHNGICRRLIALGEGDFGQRVASLTKNGDILKGFPLNKTRPLDYVYTGKIKAQLNKNKTEVILEAQVGAAYHTGNTKKAPLVSFTMAIASVSNHQWNKKIGKYRPVNTTHNNWGNYIQSQPLPVKGQEQVITLKLPLELDKPLSKDTVVVVFLGSTYAIQEGKQVYSIMSGAAMNIVAVVK